MFSVVTALGACDGTRPSPPVLLPTDAVPREPAPAHGFVLTTLEGDTVSLETVREGSTWMESDLVMPRRRLRQRLVTQFDARHQLARWDVATTELTSASLAPASRVARWRALVAHDSLFVSEGALIGVPVTLRAVAHARGVQPWHDASPAMLEQLVQAWHDNRRLTNSDAPDRELLRAFAWPGDASPVGTRLEWIGADSIQLSHPDGTWRLAISARGALLGGVSRARGLRFVRVDSVSHLASRVAEVAQATSHASTTVVDLSPNSAYTSTEVRVRASDGVTLAGTFLRPLGAAARPVAVLVSGAGPQDRDLSVPGLADYRLFGALADSLARRGVAVLRLDDRGVGASGGAAYAATGAQEANDVRSALAWLASAGVVRTDRVALVGHSDGGLTALDVASDEVGGDAREHVHALVLIGTPARSGREIARAQRERFVARDTVGFPAARRAELLQRLEEETERVAAVDSWLRAWLDDDPSAHPWQVRAPTLVLHGVQDQQVPVVHAAELVTLVRAAGAPSVEVMDVSGVNHLLLPDSVGDPGRYRALPSRAVSPQVLGPLVDWLVRTLSRTSSAP